MTIDTEAFLAQIVPMIDQISVRPPRVTVMKAQVRVDAVHDAFEALQMSAAKTAVDFVGRYPLPNLVQIMADLMAHTTPAVRTHGRHYWRSTSERRIRGRPWRIPTSLRARLCGS